MRSHAGVAAPDVRALKSENINSQGDHHLRDQGSPVLIDRKYLELARGSPARCRSASKNLSRLSGASENTPPLPRSPRLTGGYRAPLRRHAPTESGVKDMTPPPLSASAGARRSRLLLAAAARAQTVGGDPNRDDGAFPGRGRRDRFRARPCARSMATAMRPASKNPGHRLRRDRQRSRHRRDPPLGAPGTEDKKAELDAELTRAPRSSSNTTRQIAENADVSPGRRGDRLHRRGRYRPWQGEEQSSSFGHDDSEDG